MPDMIPVLIKFPAALRDQATEAARRRHTNFSEFVRQAVVKEIALPTHDENPADDDGKSATAVHNGASE